MKAAYYAAISFIDYNVGRMLNQLEDEGILDETLILFTSDHGEFLGDYNCYGKRSFLDSAARIPLLARYPTRFTPNTLCDQPVSLVDVLPTCFSVAGIEVQSQHIGTDLTEIASGKSDRDEIIGQLGQGATGLYALITSKFKYIYSAADQKEWLFRRLPNRFETRSLVGNPVFSHVVTAYRNRLIRWFKSDGYEQPIDGNQWRKFPSIPSVADDPDAEQIFQDGRSVSDRFPDGYSPKIDPTKPADFREF
jgi:arylsulfatase A-like enzyme